VHCHNLSTKLQRIESLILDLLLSQLASPVLGKVTPVLRFYSCQPSAPRVYWRRRLIISAHDRPSVEMLIFVCRGVHFCVRGVGFCVRGVHFCVRGVDFCVKPRYRLL
jgi:hypothetical protein